MPTINIGMKRPTLEKFAAELSSALASTPAEQSVTVEFYGDTDSHGHVLIISNDDMERDEVHDGAVYVELED